VLQNSATKAYNSNLSGQQHSVSPFLVSEHFPLLIFRSPSFKN